MPYKITINDVPAHTIDANFLPDLLEYLNKNGDRVMGVRDFPERTPQPPAPPVYV